MKPSYVRWGIVFLLLATSTMTWLERSSLSLVLALVQRELNFTTLQLGTISVLTSIISPLAALLGGLLIDRIGARWGMALSLALCSLANLATGAVNSAFGMGVTRGIFAAGVPTNYLAATKVLSESIAPKSRGTALGIYSLGAIIAPIFSAPFLFVASDRFGWRWALGVMGGIGLLLLLLWLWLYRQPRQNTAEVEPTVEVPLVLSVFADQEFTNRKSFWRNRAIWLLIVSNALTGQVGGFLTGWLGEQSDNESRGWLFLPIFLFTIIGMVGSGILSDQRIRSGREPQASRANLMFGATLLILFCWLSPFASSLWAIVVLVGVISLGNASWLVLMNALLLDVTPTRYVGRAMGMVVASGGWISSLVVSLTNRFESDGSSVLALVAMGGLQLVALWLVRLATRPPMPEPLT